MELFSEALVWVSLDAQSLLYCEQLKQECHRLFVLFINSTEVREVLCTKEAFRVEFEQVADLHIFVVVMLQEALIPNHEGHLRVFVVHKDLSGPIRMISNPELSIVLLFCRFIELCTFREGRH
jgi:hypothetical protein